ncbi:aldose 1-epimerase family protein [Sphingobium sufflavum]|uniref:aldose 1-epimerase family protein n=1 Tax=Sphingobium sufflavum TaxID=1129547 RepID=UPI001F3D9329|nr:aldose 1-epimerase family protein [Sphingobium sufflavum]MCE7795741.1 aldose 1-epimerase family protein [Sphingobium sufflavum]
MIEILSDALRATLNPAGAELWALHDAQGRLLMHDGAPDYWTGHAPLLFPIVGGLADDRYRLRDGRQFTLPRHGFARRSLFTVVESGPDHALFRLTETQETLAAWPFPFRLDMAFRLEGATLFTTATVTNSGDTPLPFSLGYHPAFAWPLPYGAAKADHRILFEKREPAPIRRLDAGGQVLASHEPSPVNGRTLTPTTALFEDDAMIWDRLESRSLTWGAAGTPNLRIDFPGMPMLGLWQKPGAPYLCIEPWAGIADPVGYDGVLEDKPGIVILAPGDQRAFRMDVTLVQG